MIYFMRAGPDGPVKIGWSHNIQLRMKQVRPTPETVMNVIRTVEGKKWVERWFHKQFKHLTIRREWFHFDPSMMHLSPPDERPSDIPEHPSDAKHAKKLATLHFRLDPETVDILKARASEEQRPFASYLALLLRRSVLASRAPAPPNTHASTTELKP